MKGRWNPLLLVLLLLGALGLWGLLGGTGGRRACQGGFQARLACWEARLPEDPEGMGSCPKGDLACAYALGRKLRGWTLQERLEACGKAEGLARRWCLEGATSR